jgi:CRISPR system Cascade subunit CasE
MSLYLSRARLKREPSLDALARQLLPDDGGARALASHRLIWSLFAGDPAARRDHLYRETTPGAASQAAFIILSRRLSSPDSPILDVETVEFAPVLKAGDHLAFSLRANATRTRKDANGRRRRHDVVMDALPRQGRGVLRHDVMMSQGRSWLEDQGAKNGFRLMIDEEDGRALRIDGYEQLRFPRLGPAGVISVLDFEGVLEVTEPALFLARLERGIGRAKAFGCGLMLIRRA